MAGQESANDRTINTKEPSKMRESMGDWIAHVTGNSAADARARPWKQTLGEAVERKNGVKEDLVRVRAEDDIQHSSVCA